MKKEIPGLPYYFKVAEKAASLRDKIEEPERYIFQEANQLQYEQRLTEWRKAVAPDDPAMFENRLNNDGISKNDLRSLLGDATIKSEEHLPEWISCFREMMEFLHSYKPADISSEMTKLFGDEQEKKIPFLHLLTPLVKYALKHLEQSAGKWKASLFSLDAEKMLNLQLAMRLGIYTAQTFQLEFRVFIATHQSPASRLFGFAMAGEEPENGLYLQFVDRIFQNSWQDFFAEYSSLAKIITIITTHWIHNSADFITRLADDIDGITGHFASGVPPGLLTKFKGGISDSHNHGKSVLSLQFESGLKLVYKPKNLELEQAWSELIDWFNKKGLTPGLKPLDVIQGKGYGWVGFIEAAACETKRDVEDYYRRIGALIGIIYLLNGNDCHYENLIASGSYPVLIDLESIMHHEGKTFTEEITGSAMFLASLQFGHSVLRTGLLPHWITGKDGFTIDVSALGGYEQGDSPYMRNNWTFINTDRMSLSQIPARLQNLENAPVLNQRKELPLPYTREIVEGFTHCYRLMIIHREELPVHLFAGKELRFIFRGTRIYGMIFKKLVNPKYMRTGLEQSFQTELLCRSFLHTMAPNPYWTVFKSEQKQMEDADVPIFWASSDQEDLKDPSGIVCTDFMRSAVYLQVTDKLQELSEKDLEKQLKFINAALFFRETGHNRSITHDKLTEEINKEIQLANRETLLAAALEIARKLESEAIFSKDGSCTWMSVGVIPGTERFRMQPMLMYLYDGLPGVAVFLSALTTVSDDPGIKLLNQATIRSLRQGIEYMHKYGIPPQVATIGITSGISSVIYSLLKIGAFLDDPLFVDDALKLSRLISDSLINKDKSYDIISGTAGCILGLLLLHSYTSDPETLEKAILCGNHLLENLVENPDGGCGWITMQGKMLAGFSHGQAGIAYALLKLFESTGNSIYRETAARAIQYENTLFSKERNNWQDLRALKDATSTGPNFMNSWCHGAPGIGLARLASRHILNNPAIETDIMNAIKATRKSTTNLGYRDHLCCGNMGLADILLYYAVKTADTGLLIESGIKTKQVLQDAEKTGHYSLLKSSGEEIIDPGFFQGISGIGYALLRQAYPQKFPSILIFE